MADKPVNAVNPATNSCLRVRFILFSDVGKTYEVKQLYIGKMRDSWKIVTNLRKIWQVHQDVNGRVLRQHM